MSESVERLRAAVRDVVDFPKKGIVFKDITTVLQDPELFRLAIAELLPGLEELRIDKVVGIDARGFIFGAPVAYQTGAGFVPVRKKGKLPYKTIQTAYQLEYGEAVVEVHEDAILPGERVLLVDDLLATGGTAAAAAQLLSELGAELVGMHFLIELEVLAGRSKLPEEVPVRSILSY